MAAHDSHEPSHQISLRGRQLEYYGEPVSELGEGTFGKVELYENPNNGKPYAVKTTFDMGDETESFTTILREVVFPTSVTHPNIIFYYDVYLYGLETAKLVMPVAEGDLKAVIAKGYFKDRPDRMERVSAEMISAIACLTKHNILHRDIKPQNILAFRIEDDQSWPPGEAPEGRKRSEEGYTWPPGQRSEEGYTWPPGEAPEGRKRSEEGRYTFRLADFGLAQGYTCVRDNRDTVAYTLWYRPPEILKGSEYTEKADVWALGCTLYELLGHGPLFPVNPNYYNVVKHELPDGKSRLEVVKVDAPVSGEDIHFIDNMLRLNFVETVVLPNLIRDTVGPKPTNEINWEGADSKFKSLIMSMLVIDPKERADIFELNVLTGKNVPIITPLSCAQRYTSFLSSLPIRTLFDFQHDAMNAGLRWIMMSLQANLGNITSYDYLRTASLSQILYLAMLSHDRIPFEKSQGVACAAMYISINWISPGEETRTIDYMAESTGYLFSKSQLTKTTVELLRLVKYQLLAATPFDKLHALFLEQPDLNQDIRDLATIIFVRASTQYEWFSNPQLPSMCVAEAKGPAYPKLRDAVIKINEIEELTDEDLVNIWKGYLDR